MLETGTDDDENLSAKIVWFIAFLFILIKWSCYWILAFYDDKASYFKGKDIFDSSRSTFSSRICNFPIWNGRIYKTFLAMFGDIHPVQRHFEKF